jgi:hypothetical protein
MHDRGSRFEAVCAVRRQAGPPKGRCRARRLPDACECARRFDRFDRAEGRWMQDLVIGKGGSGISMAALNVHGPGLDNVLRYRSGGDDPKAI